MIFEDQFGGHFAENGLLGGAYSLVIREIVECYDLSVINFSPHPFLIIAEAIISGAEWTPSDLAERFVQVFKRDPHEGYASSFHAFLCHVTSDKQFLADIIPTSDKSGAAMRASAIGVYATIDEVIAKTRIQAAITHNTPDGLNAAIVSALMTHYFIYDLANKKYLGEFIEQHVEGEWADAWRGKVRSKGWMSVKAAITAVQQTDGMSEMLRHCIDYSGDVDTVAVIALAAASCSKEVEQNLPQHLIDGLENGTYGRDYIVKLDQQLMSLVQKPKTD